MPFFSGLVGGFSEAQAQDRALQAQRDEAAAQRENSVLQLIATQHPDDDVRAAALATMMSPRKPGGGALGMFFNKAAQNPMMPALQGLIRGTKQVTTPGAPVQAEPAPSRLPEGASAALPAGSPTEPGGPPMSLEAIHNAMPQAPGRTVAGPPTTATVPRGGLMGGVERARALTAAEAQGKIEGMLRGVSAMDTGAGAEADPSLRYEIAAHTLGVPLTRTDDAQGDRHFFIGTREIATAKGVSKPVGPEAQIETQAQNLLAAGKAPTIEDARTMARSGAAAATTAKQTTAGVTAEYAAPTAAARLAQTRQSTATQAARLESLRASTAATWQRVNGTVPMTREQALTSARAALGNGPDVTVGDVSQLADNLWASTQPGRTGGGGVPAAPPSGAPPAAAATPPPGRLQGAVQGAGAANVVRTPKYYSEAGKQTVMAIGVVESLLPKIEATIKKMNIPPDQMNNPLPEKFASLLYNLGVSPGADMEELLQTAGMSKGYGLRGLLGGRGNQQLQHIYGQHLLDQGDSPALVLQKIHTLQANIPGIRAAVDTAENMRVGGKNGAGGGNAPPQPTYAWDSNGVRHVQTDPNAALPAGWTTTPPRK